MDIYGIYMDNMGMCSICGLAWSSCCIWLLSFINCHRDQSLLLTVGALVQPGVDFLVHCQNFRRTFKNVTHIASNTQSAHFKRSKVYSKKSD